MEREMIKKALECCHSHSHKNCPECPYNKDIDEKPCFMRLMEHSLTLINELTEENENLHASCTELTRKCESLTEENERLQLDVEVCGAELSRYTENIVQMAKQDRAKTVRKMQSEIKERCIKGGIFPAFVASTIDQIAKEMLEGE